MLVPKYVWVKIVMFEVVSFLRAFMEKVTKKRKKSKTGLFPAHP
jgi:hypothetical protein